MFKIVATLVALTSYPPLEYKLVPVFGGLEACETYMNGEKYKSDEEVLKFLVKEHLGIDTEIISTCVEIEQPEK